MPRSLFFLVILPPGNSSSVVLPYKTMWCILAKIWDIGATQIFADSYFWSIR